MANRLIARADVQNLAWALFAKNFAGQSALTGTLVETQIGPTITIPAGLLGTTGGLKIQSFWTVNNNANNKQLRLHFGGISGASILSVPATTGTVYKCETIVGNRGSASSQLYASHAARGSDGLITTTLGSNSFNTASAVDLVFSGQLANTGDNIVLEGYIIEIMTP